MQEQLIKILKTDGPGIIGKTEDAATMRWHQAALPELSCLIQEYEGAGECDCDGKHHEMYRKFQDDFLVRFFSLNAQTK